MKILPERREQVLRLDEMDGKGYLSYGIRYGVSEDKGSWNMDIKKNGLTREQNFIPHSRSVLGNILLTRNWKIKIYDKKILT